jgi:hypothetical protein
MNIMAGEIPSRWHLEKGRNAIQKGYIVEIESRPKHIEERANGM